MKTKFVLTPDADLKNADWPKKTPDQFKDLPKPKGKSDA